MPAVNLYDAKTQLSALVERAAAGEEIIIAKAGRPMARLVPLATRGAPRRLGALGGTLTIREDFNAPLPEEWLAGFNGR